MGLHTDGIDHRIGTAPIGHRPHRITERTVALVEVNRLDAAGALIVALTVQAWRTQRHRPALVRGTAVVAALLVTGTVIGALIPTPDNGILMPALSMATAAALWAALVALVVRAGRRAPDEK